VYGYSQGVRPDRESPDYLADLRFDLRDGAGVRVGDPEEVVRRRYPIGAISRRNGFGDGEGLPSPALTTKTWRVTGCTATPVGFAPTGMVVITSAED